MRDQRGRGGTLDDDGAYDAIWLPLPFLPKAIVPAAAAASARALRPGGWLLPGSFAAPPGGLEQLLIDLRVVRSGGHPWRAHELLPVLAAAGLAEVHEVSRTWTTPLQLFAGRKPA